MTLRFPLFRRPDIVRSAVSVLPDFDATVKEIGVRLKFLGKRISPQAVIFCGRWRPPRASITNLQYRNSVWEPFGRSRQRRVLQIVTKRSAPGGAPVRGAISVAALQERLQCGPQIFEESVLVRTGGGAEPGEVFEREETVAAWDDDYYHPIAEKYYDRAVPDMLAAMGVKEGDTVLDAGCGPGVHSIRAARYGAKVRAIDFSSVMLSHAAARAGQAGVAHGIAFSQDDLTRLSLRSGEYPFAFSWGVVIHVPDAEAALDQLARVTAPGGKLALHVLGEGSLDDLAERLARKVLRKPLKNREQTSLGHGNWYDFNGERLWVQRFDIGKLERAMTARGMRLVGRRGAEFSELQRRAPKAVRPMALLANSLAYGLRPPATLFCTQIVIFEQTRDRRGEPAAASAP